MNKNPFSALVAVSADAFRVQKPGTERTGGRGSRNPLPKSSSPSAENAILLEMVKWRSVENNTDRAGVGQMTTLSRRSEIKKAEFSTLFDKFS